MPDAFALLAKLQLVHCCIVALRTGDESTVSPCPAEVSTKTDSSKSPRGRHNVSIDQALWWDPIKSLRTSLPGELRLAPHESSPGWQALIRITVIMIIIINVINIVIILIVWQA